MRRQSFFTQPAFSSKRFRVKMISSPWHQAFRALKANLFFRLRSFIKTYCASFVAMICCSKSARSVLFIMLFSFSKVWW